MKSTNRAMKMSALYAPTLKEDPAEAELASHRLLLRAGMIRKQAAGLYSYLPLAWRSLKKIEAIVRDEMDGRGRPGAPHAHPYRTPSFGASPAVGAPTVPSSCA